MLGSPNLRFRYEHNSTIAKWYATQNAPFALCFREKVIEYLIAVVDFVYCDRSRCAQIDNFLCRFRFDFGVDCERDSSKVFRHWSINHSQHALVRLDSTVRWMYCYFCIQKPHVHSCDTLQWWFSASQLATQRNKTKLSTGIKANTTTMQHRHIARWMVHDTQLVDSVVAPMVVVQHDVRTRCSVRETQVLWWDSKHTEVPAEKNTGRLNILWHGEGGKGGDAWVTGVFQNATYVELTRNTFYLPMRDIIVYKDTCDLRLSWNALPTW